MIKCEALDDFRFSRFNELKNIERKDLKKNEINMIYKGDKFECSDDIADYLDKNNAYKKSFITAYETIPDLKKELSKEDEINNIPKTTKKKRNNKKVDF